MSIFLSPEDIAELTGIKRGRGGKTAHQLQCDWLKTSRIPFYINAAGRPIVATAVIEGSAKQPPKTQAWEPAVLKR